VTRRIAPLPSLAALLVLSLSSAAYAAPPGFAFLEVPAGARASGMGGAYSAIAQGAEAAFWNPAGLSGITGTEVTASHFESFANLRHEQFSLGGRMFGGGMAASVRAMYTEPIEERDALGNLTGTWGSHDLELQLGYGRATRGGVSIGFAAQLLRERLANESAMTWGLSGGLAWQPAAWRDVRASLMVQHAGPPAHYDLEGGLGDPVGLPVALHGGLAWHRALAPGLSVTPALDVRATRGRQAVVALGAELESTTGASARVGFREGDDYSDFSAGAGWRYGGVRVDYAWVPSRLDFGDTRGDSHRFSFGARF
jgi:hypothetical protein